jgi:hypothetical protein
MFVVRIGGPVTSSDGTRELSALLDLGYDVVTDAGPDKQRWTGFAPTDPRLRHDAGVAKIMHGQIIKSVSVPDIPQWYISGCVRWHERRLYELTSTPAFGFGYQINFGLGAGHYRRIPEVRCSPVAVLADETICCYGPQKPVGTYLFDTHAWAWRHYVGLCVLGASFDGHYVAYYWNGEKTMHLARISSG